MPASSTEAVTEWLNAYSHGDHATRDRLLSVIYDRLREIAHRHLHRERPGHTLNTTALVHEAYLKLVELEQQTWTNRLHFFALAARVMRHILIDYARAHRAQKRGGGGAAATLDESVLAPDERADELLALDEALTLLAAHDERLAKVVEYRFFGGLTIAETAELLDVSVMTVNRDWRKAKAWLYRILNAS